MGVRTGVGEEMGRGLERRERVIEFFVEEVLKRELVVGKEEEEEEEEKGGGERN